MKRCNEKGCNNIINDKEKYCDFHKQQNLQNGIKGVGALAAMGSIANYAWKHREKIVKGGRVVGKFVARNGIELGKIIVKKF